MRFTDRAAGLTASFWFRLVALLALAGLAVAALLPDRDQLPSSPFPGLAEHFLAYAAAAVVSGLAFRAFLPLRLLLLIIILYAGILEFAQRWAPGRTASLLDFAASAAGGLAGIILCAVIVRLAKAWRWR